MPYDLFLTFFIVFQPALLVDFFYLSEVAHGIVGIAAKNFPIYKRICSCSQLTHLPKFLVERISRKSTCIAKMLLI